MENMYRKLREIGLDLANTNESVPLLAKAAMAAKALIEAREAYALVLDENGRFQISYSTPAASKSVETLRAALPAADQIVVCLESKGDACIWLSAKHVLYLTGNGCSPTQHQMLEMFGEQTALQLRGILQHEQSALDLRRSKNRYRTLLNSLHEGIWVIDAEANTTFVNEQMTKMLGYTIEEMLGKPLFHFMDDDGVELANKILLKREQGIEAQHPFEFLHKNGRFIHALVAATPLMENGRYAGSIAGVMDITERQRAFEELHRSEERFRDLVETTSDWIWEIDAHSTYSYSSKVITELLGYTPEEVIGKSPFELMPPQEAVRVQAILAPIIDSSASFAHVRHLNTHKDGRLVPLSSTGVPILSPDGTLIGYRGIDRDITALVQQEHEHAKARQQTQLLLSVINGISQTSSFRTALEVGLRVISKHVNWVYSEAWIADLQQERLINHAQFIAPEYADRLVDFSALSWQMTFAYGEGVPGRTWVTQETAWYENIQELPPSMYVRFKAAKTAGLKAALAVPAIVHGQTMVVLMFYADRVYERESEVMELITAVASQLGLVLQQKQTQETLRKLSRAVEQSSTSIFITDLDANIEFVNPAFSIISGYSQAEALGKNPSILRDANTPRALYKEMWSALNAGGVWEGRIKNRHKDGSPVWLQSTISTIKDRDGNPTHHLCIQNDISERVYAEKALRASEAKNRALIKAIPDIMFLLDGDGVLLDNYGTEAGLSLPPQEFINLNLKEVMPRDVAEQSMIAITAALQTGKTQEFNYTLAAHTDSSVNHYEARISVAGENRVLAIIRDITTQRVAEAALRESERMLAKAQAIAHLGSWEWKVESRTLTWSDEMYQIAGYEPQSFVVTVSAYLAMLHPEDVEKQQTAVRKSIVTHIAYTVECRLKRPSGEIRYIEERGKPIYNDDDALLYVAGTVMDITDQVIARQNLEQATKIAQELQLEAERANQAKSLFLTNMSHELRTPLNGILGYTQLFKQDDQLSAEQMHGIDVIHRSGEHLLVMINDMLDLAKIEAGKMELSLSPCHLPDMLATLTDMVGQLARQKGVEFTHQFDPYLPLTVMVDGGRLRQVLLNILSNAVKFTEEGGAVLLEVLLLKTAVSAKNNAHIRFRVEDTGMGIAPDLQKIIFSPFEQAGERQNGTGLGLAISQQIATLFGSTLKVSSRLGQGSVFWFDLALPVVERGGNGRLPHADNRVAPAVPPRVKTEEKVRLLVVDDTESNRQLLSYYFSSQTGFEVMEALDGNEAVAKAEQFNPHLILMDLMMPIMDGMEAVRRIRLLPAPEKRIIIAITANAYADVEEEALQAGFDDFITKPIHLARLAERIRLLLGDEWAWLYDDAVKQPMMEGDTPVFTPLPEAETAVLRTLARNGDIANLRAKLMLFKKELDPQYHLAIEKLATLARQYRIKQMREMLEKS